MAREIVWRSLAPPLGLQRGVSGDMIIRKALIAIPLGFLMTDIASAGTISGHVRDTSIAGVENAIVYFSNTRYGCSTDSLGRFTLTGIPDGHYWLTISKTGYLRKEVEFDIAGSDTIHLAITILARPVEFEGVDIWADSQAFDNQWKSIQGVFIPGSTENGYTVFNSSARIPFGLLQLDTVTILYSLDTIIYEANTLLRFWILYANFSKHKHGFDPMHALALTVIARQSTYQDIPPIPYRQMKEVLSEQDVVGEIQRRIGGEIEKQSSTHGYIAFRNSKMHFPKFTGPLDWGTTLGELNPTKQQVLFTGSENAGVLKPYYIHPGSGVQGYVYFIFPHESEQDSIRVELDKFRYFITLELNSIVHTLSFGVN